MGGANARVAMWLAIIAAGGCHQPHDELPVIESAGCHPAAAPTTCDTSAPSEADCPASSTIDVNSLLADMANLEKLARRDCVAWRTYEASSYDRASVRPEPPSDTAAGWYANHDWGNYLATDGRRESVMLDVDGPGAIVRMWTANANGTLRVYFDGSPDPAIVENFSDLLSGSVPPFLEPFAVENSTGRNLDFPFPFRRHVKVTVDGTAYAFYYQVFYRRYDPGTDVETFGVDQISQDVLGRVASALRGTPAPDDGSQVDGCESETDQSLFIAAAAGGSELTEIDVLPSDTGADTLRQSILSLTFDGRETTRVPLGDFFGAGPGFLPHRTLPAEVSEGGTLVSRFIMPFACSAEIRIESPAGKAAVVSVHHHAAPFTRDSLHFYAHWIARGPIPTRPFRDLPLAQVEGAGRYVGTLLAVDSRVDDWWGEGDEKIWVDDDGFPSWFGTGTEDYFGYANATRTPFDHPFRALRRTGSARGQVTSARFQLLDSIPFESSLTFNLELFHWNADTTIFYDTMAYFYAAPSAQDLLPMPDATAFRVP
jgi:Protein of unknown function (DUF2961)